MFGGGFPFGAFSGAHMNDSDDDGKYDNYSEGGEVNST